VPALLEVRGLSVEFPRAARRVARVLQQVSFDLRRGECLGLVGESGSGKSVTALAILGLVPSPGQVVGGSIRLEGQCLQCPQGPPGPEELLGLDERGWAKIRGGRIALVAQEAAAALNPVLSVGRQLREVLRAHRGLGSAAATAEATRLLDRVAIPDARRRLHAYPHELSGGQRQRVLLAIGLAGSPEILLADEPTASLDGPLQAQILDLIDELRRDLGLAVLLITHDLAIAARRCDRIAVLYGGEVLETGRAETVVSAPRHPYTEALVGSLPRAGVPPRGLTGEAPDPSARPPGCVFEPRCPERLDECRRATPPWSGSEPESAVRCFRRGAPGERQ
jgi:peptide/nickel transport system ATP-binding protein